MDDPQQLIGMTIDALDTPAVVVDLDAFDRNVERIASVCRNAGVAWRPHCKSHKSAVVARLLLARGAIGVSCAKVSEAAVMVEEGIRDVLITNQVVGETKIRRLIALRRNSDVIVCVDNIENARALHSAAQGADVRLRVLIEVDAGSKRAGVLPGKPVLDLAQQLQKLAGLQLAGVMTWESHTTQLTPRPVKEAAISEAISALTSSADLCRSNGIPISIVSCGGTGTYETTCFCPGVTEVQAGGGVFGDIRYRTQYHVEVEYAMTLLVTVTSRPTAHRVITDAGLKALSADAALPQPLGIGAVRSIGFSAEHGKIELNDGSAFPPVGSRISLVPGYCDTTIHLHRRVVGVRHDRIEAVWNLREDSRLH